MLEFSSWFLVWVSAVLRLALELGIMNQRPRTSRCAKLIMNDQLYPSHTVGHFVYMVHCLSGNNDSTVSFNVFLRTLHFANI